MDKSAYKVAMCIESTLLIILVSTFYLTSYIGVDPDCFETTTALDLVNSTTANITLDDSPVIDTCVTALSTKVAYAVWVWAIFFTFPGTYSTQPAVTTQTFGHKYGGFIYAFLFSCDIINNLMVATMSRAIKEAYGYLGIFLTISGFGVLALVITCFYPYRPRPGPRPTESWCLFPSLEKLGLVEIPRGDDQNNGRETKNPELRTTRM
eukprot:TRINITY_DN4217_c0_g1_i11.p1 TRINITY_DN4217_c0_g1~~TRINITY_DN4217_c0_g1_i11.p1  ORF type:complete len:208 (-),score=33.05 TRINITY_DN4217_c0_g1_i11:443-1066(-)